MPQRRVAVNAARRNRAVVLGLAAVLLLVLAGSMLYGVKKTRDLESSALASAADATARLRDALGGKADAERVQAHAEAVAQHIATLRREDASRNRALAEAAELYLTDLLAILRNQSNALRTRAAATASRRVLAAHLAGAADRGQGWIQQALALKARAERDNFEYRVAMGALSSLYQAHRESQDKLRAAAPAAPLIEEELRARLYQEAKAAQLQAEEELERLRQTGVTR